jgi:hypothetical protein
MRLLRLFSARDTRKATSETPDTWIKSSLSMYNGNCVEVAGLDDELIRVRDSKNPRGSVLEFTTTEWDAFVGGVINGEFHRRTRG